MFIHLPALIFVLIISRRGVTGSGKTHAARLMSSQLLRLSTRSRKESKLADQINSVSYVLDSFGNSKTLLNPSASRHGRYTELHFTDNGRISGAKVLTFGLDKSRLSRLSHEERSFHVFYQLLAGATPVERDALQLEDPSDYALLASSGCYRLPGGPFSDDSAAMDELRASMKALGFKPKHIQSIFSLLLAILLLGNIQFADNGAKEVSYESATVVNLAVLDRVSALLGIPSEEFAQALSNKTNYIRKELYTVFLTADAASAQRDKLVQDLYAILFAFVTETVNHKISTADSPPPHTHIVLFDLPGFQSRGSTGSVGLTGPAPLVSAYGQNKFDEFCINFGNELLHSFLLHNTFDDATGYNSLVTSDGVPLPSINTMDNSACVELLRGAQVGDKIPKKPGGILGVMHKACSNYRQGKSSDKKDEDLLQDLVSGFGVHASFVTSPSTATGQQYTAADRMLFGINHYAGSCTYDIRGFVERDTDMLESTFVSLLRNSTDSFVAKLVSGPSMAAEMHQKDANIVVQAQVSSRPLRLPTSHLPRQSTESAELDPDRVYPVTTQLNSTLSSLLRTVDNTRVWNVACIRPNDSGSPNSFDKRRVKSQIRSLLLPDFLSRRKTDFVADVEHDEFCELYAPPSFNGTDVIQRIHAVADANHWRDGCDYAVGHRSVWLSFDAWKSVEDPIRAEERERRKALKMEGDDDDSILADPADDASPETHNWKGPIGGRADFGESADNLLRRTATGGTGHTGYYSNPSTPGYTGGDSQHPVMPSRGEGPFRDPSLHSAETTPKSMNDDPNLASKEGLVTKESRTIEEVPTSNARRWWLRFVWLMTWWIPSWCLSRVGKMKRPDVRLAWREKVTICLMIFFMCGIVIFYIIVFGRLLCPNFDRAWNTKELNEHQGQTDFWVAVAGEVYDISKFWQNDHSDITNLPATPDLMQELAGQDLTQYFPVPLSTGCPGLVSDTTLAMQAANFTIEVQTAVHTSGFLQANQGTKLDSQTWYPDVFLKAMNNYHKGPLVFTSGEVNELAFAEDRFVRQCVSTNSRLTCRVS
jgi:chitin synthase